MDINMRIQLYIFFTSVYGGLIAGLAYDVYRLTRYYFRPKKIITIIEDFLFWIGIGLIFFYLLNKNNWGQLRAYVFLGFFLGGLLYLKILSKFLSPILRKIFKGIIQLFKGTRNLILLPYKKLKKPLQGVKLKIRRLKRIPKESLREIKKYKKIIFKK